MLAQNFTLLLQQSLHEKCLYFDNQDFETFF